MRLVEQWHRIEGDLAEGWVDARLALEVSDRAHLDRAASLLGPANPGRGVGQVRFSARRSAGTGVGPEAVRGLLARIDGEGIEGILSLREAVDAPAAPSVSRTALADGWDTALATLPPDWSDLLCEVELASSDYLDRGALLLAPINPYRIVDRSAFTFRVAHRFGYGASAPMTRRCLARVDEDGITGDVTILRVLSDTHNVDTQGPVWYIGGKAL
ncbi:MAG TPA: hypothetical protein VNI55_07050 [Gaiellaceae bacterium]|nr:hypothetical protein [Gaiellaceae bacterium]